MPPVAVVIPAYNEAERIGETVTAALTLPGVDVVVVASDGSTDATVRRREGRGRDGVAVASEPGQGGGNARPGRRRCAELDQRRSGGRPAPPAVP